MALPLYLLSTYSHQWLLGPLPPPHVPQGDRACLSLRASVAVNSVLISDEGLCSTLLPDVIVGLVILNVVDGLTGLLLMVIE